MPKDERQAREGELRQGARADSTGAGRSVLAGSDGMGDSAAALEEGAGMSGKPERAQELLDELYGVDGDGLGEGEIACEAEIEDSLWLFDPYFSGVAEVAKHSA